MHELLQTLTILRYQLIKKCSISLLQINDLHIFFISFVSSYDETAMADLGSVCKFTVRRRVSSTSLVVAAVRLSMMKENNQRKLNSPEILISLLHPYE